MVPVRSCRLVFGGSQASLEFGPSGFMCVPFPFADMFPDEFLAVLCVVVGVPGEMVECVLCATDRWLRGVLGDQSCSPSFHHFEKVARAMYCGSSTKELVPVVRGVLAV